VAAMASQQLLGQVLQWHVCHRGGEEGCVGCSWRPRALFSVGEGVALRCTRTASIAATMHSCCLCSRQAHYNNVVGQLAQPGWCAVNVFRDFGQGCGGAVSCTPCVDALQQTAVVHRHKHTTTCNCTVHCDASLFCMQHPETRTRKTLHAVVVSS
jgi:hypothetical protein